MDGLDAEYEEPEYEEPEIDAVARALDERPMAERARVTRGTVLRVAGLAVAFLVPYAVALSLLGVDVTEPGALRRSLVPSVVLAGLVFETFDSASGMGFGTALTPLLLSFGYSPLEIVPVLFVTESATGLLASVVHQEFGNAEFSLRPPSDATRAVAVLAGAGIVGTVTSVALAYLAFDLPQTLLEGYVAVLVIAMGFVGLLRQYLPRPEVYQPDRLVGFAFLAGINKGVAGGGYGPVVTMGQIFAGVYEKTATAITSLAEGIVSAVGAVVYFGLFAAGFPVSYELLPSLFVGSFVAAVLAPYVVRVLPGRVLAYLIPIYAFLIGAVTLAGVLGV